MDAAEEVPALPAPVLAEFLDGGDFAGGRYLALTMQLVAGPDVTPLDRERSLVAGQLRTGLRARGEPLPMIDAMIATTALRHHGVLVTGDAGFGRVPGPAVESY